VTEARPIRNGIVTNPGRGDEERRALRARRFVELMRHRDEPGYGLRKAKEWGIHPQTAAGWFRERCISTGSLFVTAEKAAAAERLTKEKRKRAVLEAAWRGRCGVSGMRCADSGRCMYGELDGRRSARIESCGVAAEMGLGSCRLCSLKNPDGTCGWKCFRKTDWYRDARGMATAKAPGPRYAQPNWDRLGI